VVKKTAGAGERTRCNFETEPHTKSNWQSNQELIKCTHKGKSLKFAPTYFGFLGKIKSPQNSQTVVSFDFCAYINFNMSIKIKFILDFRASLCYDMSIKIKSEVDIDWLCLINYN
jgi:hypothetical protein